MTILAFQKKVSDMELRLIRRAVLSAVTLLAAVSCAGSGEERFIDDLMSQMTLAEKIGQLNLPVTGNIVTGDARSSDIAAAIREGRVGGLFNLKGADNIREMQRIAMEESRLGIPLFFAMDVIHGYETVFPIPLGLSCCWDMDEIELSARIAAREASADGIDLTFSPMVDICHDARWGRIAEGGGEDTYLGARIAEAMVRGYRGGPDGEGGILSCVKHFALYGAAEAGRDYNTADMSRWRMYNEYLPPYKAAFDAGAAAGMASFNIVDGVPATGNRWLLTELLRDDWGWDGVVMSDYTGIAEMVPHGMGNLQEVSALALKAGLDMDMVSEGFAGTLEKSLAEGLVSRKDIDRACRRILRLKQKAGLFENPYRNCEGGRSCIGCDDHRKTARRIAAESFVLLENKGGVLPLQKKGRIALIGPLAHDRNNMCGTWSVAAKFWESRTLLEGLRDAVGDKAEILYAKGCSLMFDETVKGYAPMFADGLGEAEKAEMEREALAIAARSDVIVAAMGESAEMSGEASSRTKLEMPGAQRRLLEKLVRLGKPVVLLNFSGRPVVLDWEAENVDAILQLWFGGSETADAAADVLFGDVVPGGRLTTSFPRSVGQLPMSYNSYSTGRPLEGDRFVKFRSAYLDCPNTPLYPFGYGLSYTSFRYEGFRLSADRLQEGGKVQASVEISNTGDYDGSEVVQLYIRDLAASTVRPVKELKDFKKIFLKKGESRTVTFEINEEMLKFYDAELRHVCEKGEFHIMVGPDSEKLSTLVLNYQ